MTIQCIKKPIVTLVGMGNIGTILLVRAMEILDCDLNLYDIDLGLTKYKSIDGNHMSSIIEKNIKINIGKDISILKDSDVVIITAGLTRPKDPNQKWTRDALLEPNSKIISALAKDASKYCPNAFVIIITNPLDIMVSLFQKVSNFPKNKVVGMGGITDSSRFRKLISEKLNIGVESIDAMVIGPHSDLMIPLTRHICIGGIQLNNTKCKFNLTDEDLKHISSRTINMAAEIVEAMPSGSAFITPAFGAIKIAEAYLKGKNEVIPLSVSLNGEYGCHDVSIGVPALISNNGVEKIIEIDLDDEEKNKFINAVKLLKEMYNKISL